MGVSLSAVRSLKVIPSGLEPIDRSLCWSFSDLLNDNFGGLSDVVSVLD